MVVMANLDPTQPAEDFLGTVRVDAGLIAVELAVVNPLGQVAASRSFHEVASSAMIRVPLPT
jgi:hypothetical protein